MLFRLLSIGTLRFSLLRRGDPHASAQLVAQFGARAYRLAAGITRNAGDAEEVA